MKMIANIISKIENTEPDVTQVQPKLIRWLYNHRKQWLVYKPRSEDPIVYAPSNRALIFDFIVENLTTPMSIEELKAFLLLSMLAYGTSDFSKI